LTFKPRHEAIAPNNKKPNVVGWFCRPCSLKKCAGVWSMATFCLLPLAGWAQTPYTAPSYGQLPTQAVFPHGSDRSPNLLHFSSPVDNLKWSTTKWVSRTLPEIQNSLGRVETQLYQRNYPMESLTQRMQRVEKTVFGQKQEGPLDVRLTMVEQNLNQTQRHPKAEPINPMVLGYLEERLFESSASDRPVNERLDRLEQHILGRVFPKDDPETRLQRLAYSVPLLTREVRLTNEQGQLMATTQHHSQNDQRDEDVAPVELDAQSATLLNGPVQTPTAVTGFNLSPTVPSPTGGAIGEGIPFQRTSTASQDEYQMVALATPRSSSSRLLPKPEVYSDLIHQTPKKQWLRWQKTPVRVFHQASGPADEVRLLQAAIHYWQPTLPIELVNQSELADIVVQWQSTPLPPSGINQPTVTRPILHLDTAHRIRTVILVDMAAYESFFKSQPLLQANGNHRLHGLVHQLGHALGLWGHSADPADVMYPLFTLEVTDIPRQFNSKYPLWQRQYHSSVTGIAVVTQPSAQDSRTLQALYRDPQSQDLTMMSPF